MNSAFATWVGALWSRIFDRGQAVLVSSGDVSVLPIAALPLVVSKPASPGRVGSSAKHPKSEHRADTEQSLREMIGVTTLPVGVTQTRSPGLRTRAETLEALRDLRQIPALQSLARGFTQALGRAEVSVEEVVATISKDSALCVRILRLANSVLVSSERRVEDLDTAVQMLGVTRVRNAAQALFTLRDANRVAEGFDWKHLWMHALAAAAITEELEPQLRSVDDSQVYLAALLHDVGKIVLSTIAPDTYREVLIAAWNDGGSLEVLEREKLGVDHREAGVLFAEANGLPPVVIAAIAHHDRPELAENFRFEVAIVSIANYVSKAHGLGFSGARLGADDPEFAELSAWNVIEETIGWRPNLVTTEDELEKFAHTVRDELSGLRESV